MPSIDSQLRLAELLARMPHNNLMKLRNQSLPGAQEFLAPYEHRAFAREEVEENPLKALPLAGAIPAYQLAKMLGKGARTKPSLEQALAGYKGIWEGLWGQDGPR